MHHPSCDRRRPVLDAAKGADALAIMTPWPEFKKLDPLTSPRPMRGKIVLDPYRVLDPAKAKAAGLDSTRLLGVA